jgi:hypothetical protein
MNTLPKHYEHIDKKFAVHDMHRNPFLTICFCARIPKVKKLKLRYEAL